MGTHLLKMGMLVLISCFLVLWSSACQAPRTEPNPKAVGTLVVETLAAATAQSAAGALPAGGAAPTTASIPQTGESLQTPLPSQTPAPPTPTVQPTPAAILRQLTTGGCCVQPFWSPDGMRVLYIDRPSPDLPAGIWGVGLEGGQPELYMQQLGLYSPDLTLRVFPQSGQTIVERVEDGSRWTIPSGGRQVSFSPDSSMVAWTAGPSGPPFDTPVRQVWVSQVDGSQARQVATLVGGGFAGWFPDGRLLVNGRIDPAQPEQGYWAAPLDGSAPFEITRGTRLRGASISPGGSWLVYQITFAQPEENGIWVANTRTGQRSRLGLFGAYRWRDDAHLLIAPLEPGAASHRLIQVDAATGEQQPLTDPSWLPFKISNGDWAVSPDGQHIAFVSAADRNIWVIDLL